MCAPSRVPTAIVLIIYTKIERPLVCESETQKTSSTASDGTHKHNPISEYLIRCLGLCERAPNFILLFSFLSLLSESEF